MSAKNHLVAPRGIVPQFDGAVGAGRRQRSPIGTERETARASGMPAQRLPSAAPGHPRVSRLQHLFHLPDRPCRRRPPPASARPGGTPAQPPGRRLLQGCPLPHCVRGSTGARSRPAPRWPAVAPPVRRPGPSPAPCGREPLGLRPVRASHRRTTFSRSAQAIVLPSGLTATPARGLVPPRSVRRSRSVRVSHKVAAPRPLAGPLFTASVGLIGEKAIPATRPPAGSCNGSVAHFLPDCTSQRYTLPSCPPEARISPSDEKARPTTLAVCSVKAARSSPLPASHKMICPSLPPTASNFPSGNRRPPSPGPCGRPAIGDSVCTAGAERPR